MMLEEMPAAQLISLVAPLLYVSLVFILRRVIRRPADFSAPWGLPRVALVAHNTLLSAWSLLMFIMLLYSAIAEEGLYAIFCVTEGQHFSATGYWALLMYHVSKYVELLDTLFLLLKKRRVTFLQLFHHSVMIPISYSWLHTTWKLGILGAGLNSAVHIVMYYYFARSAYDGFRPWWRLYITQFQLVQFLLSKLLIWIQILGYTPQPQCNALSWGAQWATQAMNLVFLVLFAAFFRRESSKAKPKSS